MNIEQIIFPPVPKPKIVIGNDFDYWIVGSGDNKQLMTKCPICLFTYSLQTVCNEHAMKQNLREYTLYYYNTVVRNCPRKADHVV